MMALGAPRCVVALSGHIVRVSPELENILGWAVKEIRGKPVADLVHPDDVPDTLASLAKLSTQKQPLEFENRIRCKDGSFRWMEWRARAFGPAVYATVRDITDRRQARQESEQFRVFFDVGAVPQAMISRDGRYLFVNAALERMLGCGKDEIVGRHFNDFTHPDDLHLEEGLLSSLAAGHKGPRPEKRCVTKGGETVWVAGRTRQKWSKIDHLQKWVETGSLS